MWAKETGRVVNSKQIRISVKFEIWALCVFLNPTLLFYLYYTHGSSGHLSTLWFLEFQQHYVGVPKWTTCHKVIMGMNWNLWVLALFVIFEPKVYEA